MRSWPKATRLLTATTPATSRALSLPATAKKALLLASLDDAEADRLILTASDAISRYCRIVTSDRPATFARETLNEKIWLNAPRATLILSRSPVAVTAFTIDAVAGDPLDLLVTAGGILRYKPGAASSCFPCDVEISIDYDAGYVTDAQIAYAIANSVAAPTGPSLPGDLDRATVLTAMAFYDQEQRLKFDVAAIEETDSDAGTMNTRYFNAMKSGAVPAAVEALLTPYRRPI